MEDAGTLEEDDDIEDSNIPIDHGDLAQNFSMLPVYPSERTPYHYSLDQIESPFCFN